MIFLELIINEKYKIVTDKYNFILQRNEEVNKRDGTVAYAFKDVGYFPSLPMALKRLYTEGVRDLSDTTIAEILSTIKQMEDEVTKAYQHVKNDYIPSKNNEEENEEDEQLDN